MYKCPCVILTIKSTAYMYMYIVHETRVSSLSYWCWSVMLLHFPEHDSIDCPGSPRCWLGRCWSHCSWSRQWPWFPWQRQRFRLKNRICEVQLWQGGSQDVRALLGIGVLLEAFWLSGLWPSSLNCDKHTVLIGMHQTIDLGRGKLHQLLNSFFILNSSSFFIH